MATGAFIPRGGPLPGFAYSSSSRMGQLMSREPTRQRGDDWTPSTVRKPSNCSVASLENARYHLDGIPTSDHPNEDRNFAVEGHVEGGTFQTFGVFDGHDGPRAAGFASNYIVDLFNSPSWRRIVAGDIPQALEEFFKAADKDFFQSIKSSIDEKEALQSVIPPGMKSYQAYQLYPVQVARLQEVEPKIAGGCTAVVAVVSNNHLYVANVGDSRAILIYEQANGTLAADQLTVDHTVENEDEVKRLEALGLERTQLEKAGRLGSQENTRSIGDYYIKAGYKDVDSLRHATDIPGTATPHVMPPRQIDSTFRYLVLMSDGVYKSIEGGFANQQSIEPNKVLVGMIDHVSKQPNCTNLADLVVDRIATVHRDTYQRAASKDVRSPVAVACRKRDDMTLLIYKFPTTSSV